MLGVYIWPSAGLVESFVFKKLFLNSLNMDEAMKKHHAS